MHPFQPKLLAVLTSAAILVACGGDGSSGGSGSSGASLTGTASKGILVGAVVTAYPLVSGAIDSSSSLGSTTTDSSGSYSLQLPADHEGPVAVVVTPADDDSTTMRCDVPSGCGATAYGDDYTVATASGFSLSALVPAAEGGQTLSVNPTPLTEVAARQALDTLAAAPSLTDFLVTDAIADANSATANRFGLMGDLVEQPVIDITDPAAVAAALTDPDLGADAVAYNALAGAIIEATQDDDGSLSIEDALDTFADTYVSSGGIPGNTGSAGTTSLEEILAAAQEVLDATEAQPDAADVDLSALANVDADLIADAGAAATETPDTPDAGTPSETAADGELAQAKALVDTLRDIGGSVSLELDGAANAFASQIEAAAIATEAETAAAMEALVLAAQAMVETLEALQEDANLTSHTATNGVVVTVSPFPGAAVTTAAVTLAVDSTIAANGFDNQTDLTGILDLNFTETETETDPEASTGSWQLDAAGALSLGLSGSISNSGAELEINTGTLTASVDVSESGSWSWGQTSEAEEGEVSGQAALDLALDVVLSEVGVASPVAFAGSIGAELTGLTLAEEWDWNYTNTQSGFEEGETWTSVVSFDGLSFSLSGEFTQGAQSFDATFSLIAAGNGTEFTQVSNWMGAWDGSSWSDSETEDWSDNESASNYVDLSFSLGFSAVLTGISDAVSVQLSAERTGLEAAEAGLDLAWDGNMLELAFEGDASGATDEIALTITNQDGVVLSATDDGGQLEGDIQVDGIAYANVDDMGLVRYVDGTFESLY